MDQTTRLDGAGPWLFEVPSLDPDHTHSIDFRHMSYNGRKGFFRQFLPLDDLQITNRHDSSPIKADLNHSFNARIGANTSETFGDIGITHLTLENVGETAIEDAEVIVEVASAGWNSDKEARATRQRRTSQHPAVGVIRDVIPGVDR